MHKANMVLENVTKRFIEVYNHAVETGQVKNPSQFAARISIERAPVGAILRGNRNVGLQILLNTLLAFPEISSDWLMLDRGDKIRSANVVNLHTNRQDVSDFEEKINYLKMVIKRDEEIIEMLKSHVAKLKKELKVSESGKADLA